MQTAGIGLTGDHDALRDTVRRWANAQQPLIAARAALDADAETLPPWWEELGDLGWLGLHLPEADGGSGFGLLETAIVLEELGRCCAPGPLLPTVMASAVISRFGSDGARTVLPELATGQLRAGIGLGAAPVVAERVAGRAHDHRIHGSWDAVLGAGAATHLLLPIVTEDHVSRWALVTAGSRADGSLSVAGRGGVDRTRWIGRVDAVQLTVSSSDTFAAPPGAAGPVGIAAVMAAAEAVGLAAWSVETAANYANEREQFGRPIGQFQAVKHRCADMLSTLEAARAATWDALVALDRGDDGADVATSVAASLGPEAAYSCAKDCIQVLGGIGFTWEHDAHLFLKRAMATRAVVGTGSKWRAETARLVRAGSRRTVTIVLPDEAERFRTDIRAFLAELGKHPKLEWNRRIGESGYLAPHWPTPWGRSAEPLEQLVIDEEFRAAGIRRPHLAVGAWALPTIIGHGTREQQDRFIPPTLRQELTWCQLFSEPGAGSDLASLRTRAVRSDGGWLLTGQKVWTSLAHFAHWGICLARTDPDAPKHEGIGCFLLDMASDGIDVRPLREITGAEMFNEVFLDDVFVPDDCVVGDPTDGWRAARTTLGNERVSMGSGSSMGPGLESLLELAESRGRLDDPVVADTIGGLVADAAAVSALGTRMTLRALAHGQPGPEASIRKLLGVDHDQRVQEVGLDLLGPTGATDDPAALGWVGGFLGNRSLSIAGGTSEIQRNVIAERLLGLPRDDVG